MQTRVNSELMWIYPSRKRLFLLVIVVVGLLTLAGIFLMLKSRDIEMSPQAPLAHPIVQLTQPLLPDRGVAHDAASAL